MAIMRERESITLHFKNTTRSITMENKRSDFFEGGTNEDQRRGRKSMGKDGGNQSATLSSFLFFFGHSLNLISSILGTWGEGRVPFI